MSETLSPRTGLGVLHLFGAVTPGADATAILSAVEAARSDEVQVVPVALMGHKADLGLMALGADLWRLRRFQSAVAAAGVRIVDSYVSLTELSEYAAAIPDTLKQARLYPVLPPGDMRAWCFYPMSKRRSVGANWYSLPFDERKELMIEHGSSARSFSGRVVQLVTGSTGLDDYEWGVTLFATHPDDLKEVVYTLRFDRVSATYGEFGPFYMGLVGDLVEVLATVGLEVP